MKRLVLMTVLACMPMPALAHKVIAGVFRAGSSIEGEVGFSNGVMSADTEIVVTGPDGAELGRAVTDADGFFTFTPTVNVVHTFRADLGAGHVAEVMMPAEDIAAILGVAVAEEAVPTPGATTQPAAMGGVTVASLTEEERLAIAEVVRDEVRPLRREIAAYREKNDMQSILGGLGYIAGLFGLGFYIAARRRMSS